jgi:hypothetical protein
MLAAVSETFALSFAIPSVSSRLGCKKAQVKALATPLMFSVERELRQKSKFFCEVRGCMLVYYLSLFEDRAVNWEKQVKCSGSSIMAARPQLVDVLGTVDRMQRGFWDPADIAFVLKKNRKFILAFGVSKGRVRPRARDCFQHHLETGRN